MTGEGLAITCRPGVRKAGLNGTFAGVFVKLRLISGLQLFAPRLCCLAELRELWWIVSPVIIT
jgi:hypothetical protein